MICEYDSSEQTSIVKRGNTIKDEMCRSQLIYYPQENWNRPVCLGYKHVPLCKFETTGLAYNCNYKSFIRSLATDLLTIKVLKACGNKRTCSRTCLELVAKERQHACLQGELYDLWKSNVVSNPDQRLVRLYGAMIPCEREYEANAHLVISSHGRGSSQPVALTEPPKSLLAHSSPIPAITPDQVPTPAISQETFQLSQSLNQLFDQQTGVSENRGSPVSLGMENSVSINDRQTETTNIQNTKSFPAVENNVLVATSQSINSPLGVPVNLESHPTLISLIPPAQTPPNSRPLKPLIVRRNVPVTSPLLPIVPLQSSAFNRQIKPGRTVRETTDLLRNVIRAKRRFMSPLRPTNYELLRNIRYPIRTFKSRGM